MAIIFYNDSNLISYERDYQRPPHKRTKDEEEALCNIARKQYEKRSNGVVYFIVGNEYSLISPCPSEFKPKERRFICKGIVNKLNDVIIDGVIMKRIDNSEDTIFSLTKEDCETLNIEYESGLQLYPMNMKWIDNGKNSNKNNIKLYESLKWNFNNLSIILNQKNKK